MSVRSASRGNPAASSIRLALRTSSIVATRRASFVRWVLRCFGRGRLSSAPKPSAISLMPSIMRFQEPPKAESLNHTSIPHVNNLPAELIDGKRWNPGPRSGVLERQPNQKELEDGTSRFLQNGSSCATIHFDAEMLNAEIGRDE